jgi:hypothetical protein
MRELIEEVIRSAEDRKVKGRVRIFLDGYQITGELATADEWAVGMVARVGAFKTPDGVLFLRDAKDAAGGHLGWLACDISHVTGFAVEPLPEEQSDSSRPAVGGQRPVFKPR